jgi:hypothetical protein
MVPADDPAADEKKQDDANTASPKEKVVQLDKLDFKNYD